MNAINGDQILALLESLSRPSFPAELARVLLATLDVDAVRLETIADGAAGPTTIAEVSRASMMPGQNSAPRLVSPRATGATLAESAQARVVLTLASSGCDDDAAARDVTALARLLPLIRSLWLAHARGLALEAERNALFEAIGQRGLGAITLDRRAAPISISRRATELMRATGTIGFTPARLVVQDPTQAMRLRDAVAALLDDLRAGRRAASRCVMLGDGERGSTLRVQLCPTGASLQADAARMPAMVAVIEDLQRDLRPDVRENAARFGLTAVETELVCRLVQGCALDRAAVEQRISIHTARKYLQQIFAKTQTCRQADLMRLLISGSPPPLPALHADPRAVRAVEMRATSTLQPDDALRRRVAR